MTQDLDQTLAHLFDDARSAPQWDGGSWPDARERVARGAWRARLRAAAATTAALAVVSVGAVAGLHAVGSTGTAVISAPVGAPSGETGLKWLLTPPQFAAYEREHPQPSQAPTAGPSPVPLTQGAAALRDQLVAAVSQGADATAPTVLRVDSADGGHAGDSVVWLRLADGTPVAAERETLTYPVQVGGVQDGVSDPSATVTGPSTWADGTAWAAVTGGSGGYSFGETVDKGHDSWSGPWAFSATPDGTYTWVSAPVPVSELTSWLQRVDDAARG